MAVVGHKRVQVVVVEVQQLIRVQHPLVMQLEEMVVRTLVAEVVADHMEIMMAVVEVKAL